MKVGDYVRSEDGIITRIKSFYEKKWEEPELIYARFLCEDYEIYEYPRQVKSSPNIIDLIEVGDFITYEKDNIYINIPTSVNGVFDETTLTIVKMVDNEYLKDVNIKSIITHEQMESIKYKLGE